MRGAVLLADFLPTRLTAYPQAWGPGSPGADPGGAFDWDAFVAGQIAEGTENLYAQSVERMEREVLVRVLRHTAGNQVQAARVLGITRGSLRNKIRTLGISIARSVWSDEDGEEP
jgi:two-component system nitrogen regulation response regulator GlnG